MIKRILQVVITALLSYIMEQRLHSWVIVICASIVSICIPTTHASAFWGGSIAISLLWMAKAAIIDVRTNSILSVKIAPLFGLKSSIALIILTGLIGGILGGLGGMVGHQLYKLLFVMKKDDFCHD